MRSLFLKIFLWFWGAMILIGVALFFVVTTTRPDPLPLPWRESTGEALAAYASTAADIWEQKGRLALADYLAKQETRFHSRFLLFDDQGYELSGHRGPPRDEVFPGPPPQGAPPQGAPPQGAPPDEPPEAGPLSRLPFFGPPPPRPRPETLQALRRRAWESEEAVFEMAGPRVLAARSVRSSSGRRYVLQTVLPRPRFGRPAAEPRTQWLGVLVVLALSGLVCLGLVRYLTAPMMSLRAATRRLAEGDLSARTGAAGHARRDEVADLGRDFDAMAERIEALVLAQRRLLGDISHELRSPLSRLSMALALTRRYVAAGASEEEINVALDRIKRETGRLNALIEQLLQLVRLEGGEVGAEVEPVELELLVREVVTDADFEARGMNRLVHVTQSCPCTTTGSRDLLRSAVENVVRNAVRYTAPGTTVEVSLDCRMPKGHEPALAVIRVRDHGEGVPEESLPDLFRPFYRVADARDRESGGVGLGLAITERAVRSHGGEVTAQNAPDGGLLVELRLPIQPRAS